MSALPVGSVDRETWRGLGDGELLTRLTPGECANYLIEAGYASTCGYHALAIPLPASYGCFAHSRERYSEAHLIDWQRRQAAVVAVPTVPGSPAHTFTAEAV
jgi:hypothetical protein